MVEKIVSIKDRIDSREQKRVLKKYHEKIQAIKKVTHCSSCHMKCPMCGKYLESNNPQNKRGKYKYHYGFCESCRSEFEDYLLLTEGERTNQVIWHNKEWKRMWSAWLQYQKAITEFINSTEFRILMEELD